MGLDTKAYWLTDRQSQCDFDFELRVCWTEPAVTTDPSYRHRERTTLTNSQLSDNKKNLVLGPRWVLDNKTDLRTDHRLKYKFGFDFKLRVTVVRSEKLLDEAGVS
jgi:hypothetical protein